jgi:hypothetical protein
MALIDRIDELAALEDDENDRLTPTALIAVCLGGGLAVWVLVVAIAFIAARAFGMETPL